NVYPVLERLAARHAIRRIEARRGTRYAAYPPERLLNRLGADFQDHLDHARHAFRDFSAQAADAAVVNLRDRTELFAEAHEMLTGVDNELLIAVQPAEAGTLAGDLAGARDRGVSI